MQLDPIAGAEGVRLIALGTIGSTNIEARRRAANGERGPLWITAEAQTQGRGRMDRAWSSPAGNLYASLLLHDPSSLERAPELAFVSAVALRDAIIGETPELAPQLKFKWPNDLLLAKRKCAGILIEGETGKDASLAVVIGIGVNCVTHPQGAAYPATDLRAHGAGIGPTQLFRRLSATMCQRLAQWNRGSGFDAIVGEWSGSALGIGESVTVRSGSGEKSGRFAGLDPAGRLILEHPGGGIEKISAGDVFPLEQRN
jgi:BirA family transcriptional regulator, biotin operon repressor / biotin---[acetyl-CoA-carboxylase] ligase